MSTFDEMGYEDSVSLKGIRSVEKFMSKFNMKEGHAAKLKDWLDEQYGPAAPPPQQEVLPELPVTDEDPVHAMYAEEDHQ